MNPGRGPRRLIEQLQGAGEVDVGIRRDQAGDGQIANRLMDQDGAGASLFYLGRVGRVGEKSELSRDGVFHAGDTGDLDFSVAHQVTAKLCGELAQSHALRYKRTARCGSSTRFAR